MKKFILCLSLVGCVSGNEPINTKENETDSVIIKSRQTVITSVQASEEADKSIDKKVGAVVGQINSLKMENMELSRAVSLKTVIRDTVYITEKKNFWGKTRKTVDSSQGITTDTVDNK